MDQTGNSTQQGPASSAAGQPPARRRSPWPILIIVIVVLAVGGTIGWRWYSKYRQYVGTDNATIQGDVVSISSKIQGTVTGIDFDDNERVKEGQTLVKLDPTDYELALAQAQAALTLAQQQAQTAESGVSYSSAQSGAAQTQARGGFDLASTGVASAKAAVKVAQDNLASSKAKLEQARVKAEQAERDLERARKLADAGVIPTQNLDQAETAARVARTAVDAAEKEVAVDEGKLDQAQAGVDAAQAQVEQSRGAVQSANAQSKQTEVQQKQYEAALAAVEVAQTAVDTAQQRLSYTTISAPEAGRVGRRSVQVGQQVSPGQPLMALVPDRLWVTANFKETQLTGIEPGLPVEVRVDTFPGKIFNGHVDSLSPASGAMFALLPPENASGNFTKVVQRIPVKIVLDPDTLKGYEELLRPGMSVIVKIKVR